MKHYLQKLPHLVLYAFVIVEIAYILLDRILDFFRCGGGFDMPVSCDAIRNFQFWVLFAGVFLLWAIPIQIIIIIANFVARKHVRSSIIALLIPLFKTAGGILYFGTIPGIDLLLSGGWYNPTFAQHTSLITLAVVSILFFYFYHKEDGLENTIITNQ